MRFLVAVLLAAALPAAAEEGVPEKGEGTITLQGGARVFLPGNDAYISDVGASHRAFQPQGIVGFGYQYDEELHFKIEIGYATDTYRMAGGEMTVKSIPILLGLDTALMRGSWYTVYGGGGIGYSLNNATRNGNYNEANSTAAYLALGMRMKLGGRFALVVEDRYTLARAAVDPLTPDQQLNVGGNLFSLGILFHFLEPDEKGHPQAP
jgi:hypothetical protein